MIPDFEMITTPFELFSLWQYRYRQHGSARKEITGSVVLCVLSDAATSIFNRHIVLKNSSQWIARRNVIKKANTVHKGSKCLQMFAADESIESLTLIVHDIHPNISLSAFRRGRTASTLLCFPYCDPIKTMFAAPVEDGPWKTIKETIDRVHKHFCGNSAYSDAKLMLIGNTFWIHTVKRYLNDVVKKFVEYCRS